MEHEFKQRRDLLIPRDNTDFWSLAAVVDSAMSSLDTGNRVPMLTATAHLEDVTLRAETLIQIQHAVNERQSEFKDLWLIRQYQQYPNRSLTMWIDRRSGPTCHLYAESTNEAEARGWIEILTARTERWLADPEPFAPVQPAPLALVAPAPEGWWKRNWRDHTAALVVGTVAAVIGGVGAIVLAVVFGING